MNAELDEKEAFYSLLDKTVWGIKKSDIILMMGDFNAQVGNNNQDIEHILVGMECLVIKKMKTDNFWLNFVGNMAL
jgi:hypothetical protein